MNTDYNEKYGYTKSGDAAWVASRKAAGAAIDVETCGFARWYGPPLDPYNTGNDPVFENGQRKGFENNLFVCGPGSDGWVHESDLPSEKRRDLYARGAREDAKEAKEKGITVDQLHRVDDFEVPF